jgi:hypothetical protein
MTPGHHMLVCQVHKAKHADLHQITAVNLPEIHLLHPNSDPEASYGHAVVGP